MNGQEREIRLSGIIKRRNKRKSKRANGWWYKIQRREREVW